jgi:hypothetical protein
MSTHQEVTPSPETTVNRGESPQSSDRNLDLEKHHVPSVKEVHPSSQFTLDPPLERRIRWKCDLKLLPPLVGLFLITFIDRTNIANAKIQGMTTELHMVGNDYNKALWILNIPYIIFGLPSNMLMKKDFVKPSTYLSGLMFCWGM